MAKLWFQNSRGQERVIMTVNNFNDVFTGINNFLDEHNYKSYYIRSWEEDGLTMLDINKWKRSHRILFRLSIIFLWIIYMIIFIAFIILGTCSWFVKEIVGIFK